MGFFTKNTRWNVAVHEAGHVIVGRKLGARGLHAVLLSDTRGHTTPCTWRGSRLEEATYCLAGAAAGRLITGDPALCDSGDAGAARKALARTKHTVREAEELAVRLVRQHRRAIERAARELYRTGRI